MVRYANWAGHGGLGHPETKLLADGYVETGPFAVGRTQSEFDSAYRFRDGIIHYASPSSFIAWVTALQ